MASGIVTEFFPPTPISESLSHGSPKKKTGLLFLPGVPYTRPNLLHFFPDRRKREIAYLGMFKAKVLVLGPCEVNF